MSQPPAPNQQPSGQPHDDRPEEGLRAMGHHDDGHEEEPPIEIAMVGDLTDSEAELTDRLLGIPPGEECTIYFDSPGGSPYCAMSLMSIIKLRRLKATGIVTGECSSATLWPFAACHRRIVTPYSVLLFHPMRWQSEENVGLSEAAEWARHFGQLEQDMDHLLARMFDVESSLMDKWITPGRYVGGREVAEAGIAELVEFDELSNLFTPQQSNEEALAGARQKNHRPAARRAN